MALGKREKTSFMISIGVHVAAIAIMTYGLFSVPSLPEPPQGEISIDFDLSGGFNNVIAKKSPENISKKPIEKTAGKVAQADVGRKEIVEKIAAVKKQEQNKDNKEQELKKKTLEDQKRQEIQKKEREIKKKKAEEKHKKALDEKKKLEDKKKKDLAEKKKAEEKKKKALAEKKRQEKKKAEEKKKKALLEKKKKEEGKKKRFDDSRIANLLKSKENNKATKQKSAGSGKDPVADILSKQSSKNTGAAGKQGNKNASKAYKLGGGLGWSDKSAVINALRPCWERYQGVANGNVVVDFKIDSKGYLKGSVEYVSGNRMAFAAAKRAVPECASPMKGVNIDKISRQTDGFRVTFTPLDIRF